MINFFDIVISGFLLHTTHLWCVPSVQKKYYTSLRKTASVLTRYEHVVATLRCVLYVAIFVENYSACYHYFVTTVVSTVETVTCTPEGCLILE